MKAHTRSGSHWARWTSTARPKRSSSDLRSTWTTKKWRQITTRTCSSNTFWSETLPCTGTPEIACLCRSCTRNKIAGKTQKTAGDKTVDLDELRQLILEPFDEAQFARRRGDNSGYAQKGEYHYLVNPFTVDVNMSYYRLEDDEVRKHLHHRFSLTALVSTVRLTLKPSILADLRQFMEYFQFQMMLPYLQRYKPRRRPLTIKLGSKDPAVKRVRRQIIKDWFSYVVWSNRLKRVLANDVWPELLEEEIDNNRVRYEKALERLRNPRDNGLLNRDMHLDRGYDARHLSKIVAPIIDEAHERQSKEQAEANMKFFKLFLQKFIIVVKLQSVEVEMFDGSDTIQCNGRSVPNIRVVIWRTRLGVKIDKERLQLQVLHEDIKLFDTLIMRNRTDSRLGISMNESLAAKPGFKALGTSSHTC